MTEDGPIYIRGGVDENGRLYVYLCPLCLQPLAEGQKCNSATHQAPEDENADAIAGMRSTELSDGLYKRELNVARVKDETLRAATALLEASERYIGTLHQEIRAKESNDYPPSNFALAARADDWVEETRRMRKILRIDR